MRMSMLLQDSLRRFGHCERGTILPFALMVSILLLMMGALAVNTVRFENSRSTMQATLDICVLNAASLRQTLDERAVFNDCVTKNGLDPKFTTFTAQRGTASKSVSATSSVTMEEYFLHPIKPKRNDAVVNAASSAAERVGNVEISLVLDVSGSMDGTRIERMRTAAQQFVSTLLADDAQNRVSITLIPYSGQVNLGPDLATKFNISGLPGTLNAARANSACVDLPSSVYSATAMSRTLAMNATLWGDSYSSTPRGTGFESWSTGAIDTDNVWCQNNAANHVRLPDIVPPNTAPLTTPAQRIQALNTRIGALTAQGATSINAGMRWGLAFLDPAARSIFAEYVAVNRMPTKWADRPHEFNDPDVLKVIVLMTDGSNFAEERFNTAYRSGLSPIWMGNDGNYSIFLENAQRTSKYWVPHNGTWRSTPWRNSTNTGAAPVQMTWPQVWATFRASYVANQFYARGLRSWFSENSVYSSMMSAFRTQTAIATMDSQLQQSCNLARDRGVVVYTIAFEAPAAGQTQLRNCATTLSRYYTASSTTISSVFSSIAGNISKLRLTQ